LKLLNLKLRSREVSVCSGQTKKKMKEKGTADGARLSIVY